METRLYLLDMDGTIYLDNEVIEGAVEAVNRLRGRARICFLTNNSSKSRKAYLQKLTALGFAPAADEIYTSGMCAAQYLASNCPQKTVFVLGTASLKEELAEAGVRLSDERADIVLLGYDTDLTYDRLAKACVLVRNGAEYYATHPDINCPAKGGYVPDTGAFAELIAASTGKRPSCHFGKPGEELAKAISQRFKVAPRHTAMVGDRLYTDMQFAHNNGYKSILVLSGETTTPDPAYQNPITTTLPSIKEI